MVRDSDPWFRQSLAPGLLMLFMGDEGPDGGSFGDALMGLIAPRSSLVRLIEPEQTKGKGNG
jgi:hypothetical protein